MDTYEIVIQEEECPVCGGEPTPLGILFDSAWARCRNCGAEFVAGIVRPIEVQETNYG